MNVKITVKGLNFKGVSSQESTEELTIDEVTIETEINNLNELLSILKDNNMTSGAAETDHPIQEEKESELQFKNVKWIPISGKKTSPFNVISPVFAEYLGEDSDEISSYGSGYCSIYNILSNDSMTNIAMQLFNKAVSNARDSKNASIITPNDTIYKAIQGIIKCIDVDTSAEEYSAMRSKLKNLLSVFDDSDTSEQPTFKQFRELIAMCNFNFISDISLILFATEAAKKYKRYLEMKKAYNIRIES